MPGRQRSRRRLWRRLLLILGVLGLIVVAAGLLAAAAWHDVRVAQGRILSARHDLEAAENDTASLDQHEGRLRTLARIQHARGELVAGRRELVDSRPVAVLQLVPLASRQRSGALRLVDDSIKATDAARHVLTRVDEVAAAAKLAGGAVPLAPLSGLTADVRAAAAGVRATARNPRGLWLGLKDARQQYNAAATKAATRLREAADGLAAARSFAGEGGKTRRYLVVLQNNAEMRAQGMVLSYATVTFADGRLTFEHQGPITELALAGPVARDVPLGTRQLFGPFGPAEKWQAVNFSADFTWSAETMAVMFKQKTGQDIDGIIGLDVPAIAAVLRVVGPVSAPAIAGEINAENAGRVLLHDFYNDFPRKGGERKEALGDVAEQMTHRLTTGTFDVVQLGRELGDAAAGQHLRLWSRNPQEQQTFEHTGLGGGPAAKNPERTFFVAVENLTATKLDYFIKPRIAQHVTITPAGTAVVETTVTLANTAPVGAAPSYQLGPDSVSGAPGNYTGWVLVWGPRGSVQSASVDEAGLRLNANVVHVIPGREISCRTVTAIPHAVENGVLRLRFVPQPRMTPVPLHLTVDGDGWDLDRPVIDTTLDVVRTVEVGIHRG